MSPRGLLIALGVLVAFLLVFVPIVHLVIGGGDERIDAERLRRVYVGLSLYEMEHDGRPAPNLGLVRRDVEPSDFQSIRDPRIALATSASGKTDLRPFPLDPARPTLPLTLPFPVSWSYRWHWPEAGRGGAFDVRQGLLASWWTGSIDAASSNGVGCTGPVLRIDGSGALVHAARKSPNALVFADLFGK